jgi:PKD repeat protein
MQYMKKYILIFVTFFFLCNTTFSQDVKYVDSTPVECGCGCSSNTASAGTIHIGNYSTTKIYELDLTSSYAYLSNCSCSPCCFSLPTSTASVQLSTYNSNPGWQYSYVVNFSCSGQSTGTKTATVNIRYYEKGTNNYQWLTFNVQGNCTGNVSLSLPESVSIGNVCINTTSSTTFNITNTGAVATSPFECFFDQNDDNAFEITPKFSGNIAPGAAGIYQVSFTPTESKSYTCIYHCRYYTCQNNSTYRCTSTQYYSIIVTITGAGISAPTANFSASPITGATPLTINFTDSSTGFIDGQASWYWDFGDGNSSYSQSPAHTYNSADTFTVTQTVCNFKSSPCTCSSKTMSIVTCSPPKANFSYSVFNDSVYFTNQSSGNPLSYFWNFGDGDTLTEQNPNHKYTTDGNYSVTLTVINSCGNNSSTQNVTIPPVGIIDLQNESDIIITFDPSTEILNIVLPVNYNIKNPKAEIALYNMQGQLIKSLPLKQLTTEINISGIAKEVYVVQVKTEKSIIAKKFIKE